VSPELKSAVAAETLEEKTCARAAVAGVIGPGYLGLPMVGGFGKSPSRVVHR
jgi:hypothetical protein